MLIQDPPAEVSSRLWMLGTTGYPLYLYRGAEYATLFEGGIGPLGAVLRQQLADLDLPGHQVRQLVITHAHPDHVMAVPVIRQLCPAAAVIASPLAAQTLSVEKAVAFFCKMDDALTGSLIAQGLASEDQRRPPLAENRIAVDHTVGRGDRIEVDAGVGFEVIPTPGHSECSLSFYEPQARLLIISDATGYYLPEHGSWWPNYFSDYGSYVASMRELASLNAATVCLSHNGAIRGEADVAEYFQQAIADTEAYHQRIVAAVQAGRSVRELAEALGSEVHQRSRLMPLDFFQKNCGILVKNSLKFAGLSDNPSSKA